MSSYTQDGDFSFMFYGCFQPFEVKKENGKKVLEIFVSILGSETFFALGEEGDRNYFLLKVEKLTDE